MKIFLKIRPYLILTAMLLGAFLYLNGTRVIKKIPGINLFHSDKGARNFSNTPPVQEIDWNRVLMGSTSDPTALQRVSLMLDRIEREKSWGRVGLAEQGTYHRELMVVSENSVSSVTQAIGSTQGQRVSRTGKQAIEQNDDLSVLRTPAAVAAGIAAVYTGRTIRYKISDNLKLGSKTQMNQSQFNGEQLHVITPWINAMLAYTNTNSSAASSQPDSLQTSVSKEFNDLGLSAKASYGNSGSTSYGVSKSVTREISVSYDESMKQGDSARNRAVGVGYSHGF